MNLRIGQHIFEATDYLNYLTANFKNSEINLETLQFKTTEKVYLRLDYDKALDKSVSIQSIIIVEEFPPYCL